MDHSTTSPCRHSPSGRALQAPRTETPPAASSPGPGPASEAAAVKACVLPDASGHPPEPPGGGIDFGKVGKNAVVSAISIGGCFGTMVALNAAVRATPGMPTPVKVFTGLLPTASFFPTPWVEDGLREALNTSATFPVKPTLAHDAVASVCLFLFNAACIRSARVPKFPAASRAGMGAAVLQAAAASVLAGGASELTAQQMNLREAQSGDASSPPAHIDNGRKATGRVLSLVPAAALQTGLAVRGKPLPPSMSLLPPGVVTGGWSFRRVLIPPEAPAPVPAPAPARIEPQPVRHASTELPWWGIPVTDIPPA